MTLTGNEFNNSPQKKLLESSAFSLACEYQLNEIAELMEREGYEQAVVSRQGKVFLVNINLASELVRYAYEILRLRSQLLKWRLAAYVFFLMLVLGFIGNGSF